MAYAALTAFLDLAPTDKDGPDVFARFYADRWSSMSPAQLEAELLPMFERMKRACEELKRTDRLSVLEG